MCVDDTKKKANHNKTKRQKQDKKATHTHNPMLGERQKHTYKTHTQDKCTHKTKRHIHCCPERNETAHNDLAPTNETTLE